MRTAKTRDIKASLQKKGYRAANGDHKYYHLYVDDKKTSVFTKISHSEDEVDSFILKQMARQTKLSDKQFENLIKCPLTYEEYIKILREKSIIK